MAELVFLTLLAGLCIPVGAAVALIERIRPNWLEEEFRHSVIALGGGVLLSAVALVLVPEGAEHFGPAVSVAIFLLGGGAFMALDRWLAHRKGSASQFIAMLADFVPEAIALGATFSVDPKLGVLLAILIGLQNLPEGFNAFRELRSSTALSRRALLLGMGATALLGPACGLVGHFFLRDHPATVGAIMLFAGGGILYLIFEDIAPQAKLENAHGPPFAAVLGFAGGLLGHLLLIPS